MKRRRPPLLATVSAIAVASILLPGIVLAATTCCSCTPPNNSTRTCLTIDSSKISDGGSSDCSLLPTAVPALKGYSCQRTALSNSDCQSEAEHGVCKAGPTDAYAAAPGSQAIAPPSGNTAPEAPPIIPQLNVQIPNLTFRPDTNGQNPLLAQYIDAAYRYLISISTVAATIMFVWGAFLYMLGSANVGSIARGKQIMVDAIVGLLLVLSGSLIIRIINPEAVKLRSLTIQSVGYSDYEPSIPGNIGPYTKPQAICRGQECAQYCNACVAKQPLPDAPWIPKASELTRIQPSTGLDTNGKGNNAPLIRREAAAGLAAAGLAAQQAPGGPYTLIVTEAYRPLENQMWAACQKLCGRTEKQFAAPGASLHGTGIAVDLTLWKDGRAIVSIQDPLSKQGELINEQNARTLQGIMGAAGFVQYCPEIWHWEYGVPEGGEKSKHCAWPPPPPLK